MVGCVTNFFSVILFLLFPTLTSALWFCYATACNLINNEMKQFIISSETDAIREAEERVIVLLEIFLLMWIFMKDNHIVVTFLIIKPIIVGWSSWDCSCYQRRSKTGAEKEPWRSSTLSAHRSWTKIVSRYWWKVFNVCIRPEFTSDAAQLELELYFSCMLSCFSFTESTGNFKISSSRQCLLKGTYILLF